MSTESELLKAVRVSSKVVSDPRFLNAVGDLLVSSIIKNFKEHGRVPTGGGVARWRPVSPKYAVWKRKKGKDGANILQFSGLLMNNMGYRVEGGRLFVTNNRKYARAHNDGATIAIPSYTRKVKFKRVKKNGKTYLRFAADNDKSKGVFEKEVNYPAHSVKIWARPFVVIQKQDLRDIVEIAKKVLSS
jgi:phage gpG-like protein